MPEQATPNTTAQPAAQQTAPPPATSAPAMTPDTLVEVKVDGRPYQEPLSKVVASYQMQSAAEKRFQESNRLLQQHKGDIEFAQRLRSRFQSDPEGALLELRQHAQQQLGRPVRLPGEQASGGEPGDQTGGSVELQAAQSARDQQIRELRDEILGMKTASAVDLREREIDAEVNRYPMWRNDSEQGQRARELAKLTISAMKGSQPEMSVSDLASEVHSRMQALVSQQATQVRDARQQRVESMPAAPTQGGTPEMTTQNPEGWGTKKVIQSGVYAERLKQFMGSINSRR